MTTKIPTMIAGITILFLMGAACIPFVHAGAQPQSDTATIVHQCDVLAAHPLDPQRRAAGVAWDALSAESAVSACTGAFQHVPHDPGVTFQLGRALEKAGRQQEARFYYLSAVEKQYPHAFCTMGLLQLEANKAYEAFQWYTRGAKVGASDCQFMLGEMYRLGFGFGPLNYFTKNYDQARHWYEEAQRQGHPDAEKALVSLAVQPSVDTLNFFIEALGGF